MMQGSFFRLLLFATLTQAVPLQRVDRIIRNTSSNITDHSNECISDDVVYHNGDQVPSPGPCEQCYCDPPNVICTMIKCKVNSGCKTIQRANHCCPDYKCECEYNGRIYNNGARLDRPDDPCQVCYCKGGEVMCTSITCYEREDCKPHYIPGQCCPKYDHCPIESRRFTGNSIRSVNSTIYNSKREMQPWLLTKAVSVQPITSSLLDVSTRKVDLQTESTTVKTYPQTLRVEEIIPTISELRNSAIATPTIINRSQVFNVISSNIETKEPSKTTEAYETTTSTANDPSSEHVSSEFIGTENSNLINDFESSTLSLTLDFTNTNIENESTIMSKEEDEFINVSENNETESTSIDNDYNLSTTPESYEFNDSSDTQISQHKIQLTDEFKNITSLSAEDHAFPGYHNSTNLPEITMPTSESFTIFPNDNMSYNDSDSSESRSIEGTSTEILSGGIFEDYATFLNNSAETTEPDDFITGSTTIIPIEDMSGLRTQGKIQSSSEESSNIDTLFIDLQESKEVDNNVRFKHNNFSVMEVERIDINPENLNIPSMVSREIQSTTAASPSLEEFGKNLASSEEKMSSSSMEDSNSEDISDSSSTSSGSDMSSETSGQHSDGADISMPPILQLNDQIQYLKIGGHHDEHDISNENTRGPIIHVDIFNINSKRPSCNLTINKNEINGTDSTVSYDSEGSESSSETVRVSTISFSLDDLNNKNFSETIHGVKLNNSSVLIFNTTEEKEQWAAEVLQQIVSNIKIPLNNTVIVDEIITLSEKEEYDNSTQFQDEESSTIIPDTQTENISVNNESENGQMSTIPELEVDIETTTNTMTEDYHLEATTDSLVQVTESQELRHSTVNSDSAIDEMSSEKISTEAYTLIKSTERFDGMQHLRNDVSQNGPNYRNKVSTEQLVQTAENDIHEDKSRKLSKPDTKYLIHQFPTTIEERDMITLNDLLNKHTTIP